jgi:uroporphyrinogen III methyltransferase/synthase
MSGRVQFVGAGPGAPDLITVRGLRALQQADVVCYDALVDTTILDDLHAELIYVGKRCGRHSRTQEEINELLASLAQTGRNVVRLKGGDPGVLGRVGEEALYLRERGISFEIVPGVSSSTSVPLSAGIPVTHRGVADSFALATAHRRKDELAFSIPPYRPRTTLLLLMPLRTVSDWSRQLLDQGYPADLPLAFISHGSRVQQRVLQSTVGTAAEDSKATEVETPTLVVVGRVVELRDKGLRWFPDQEAQLPEGRGPGELEIPSPISRRLSGVNGNARTWK